MSTWAKINAGTPIGGFKYGSQNADHNGWILLNGRLLTALTATQQAYRLLNYPTWVGNIPNFNGSELVDNGGVLGTVTGTNSYSITQANLPNYTMSGSLDFVQNNHGHNMANAGNTILHPGGGGANFNDQGNGNNAGGVNVNIGNAGVHNHVFPVQLGQGTAISTETSYMNMNVFVYLGL